MEKEKENSYWKMKRSPEERHTQTYSIYFDNHRCLSQSEESKYMLTHNKEGATWEFLKKLTHDAIFIVCLHTFTLFWLRKTSVIIEIYQIRSSPWGQKIKDVNLVFLRVEFCLFTV